MPSYHERSACNRVSFTDLLCERTAIAIQKSPRPNWFGLLLVASLIATSFMTFALGGFYLFEWILHGMVSIYAFPEDSRLLQWLPGTYIIVVLLGSMSAFKHYLSIYEMV